MSKRILLPIPLIHQSGAELLSKEATVIDGSQLREADAADVMATIHGIYSQPGIPEFFACTTGEQMDRAPQLEVIGVSASGFDWLDLSAATERGIPVVYAAGAQFSAVAEHGIGLWFRYQGRSGSTAICAAPAGSRSATGRSEKPSSPGSRRSSPSSTTRWRTCT